MKVIYAFNDPCEFLHHYWLTQKKEQKSLSIRNWAHTLGIKQHNHLYDMLKGRRKIPSHYIPNFIDNLSLSKKEGKFFEMLVLQKNAKQEKEQHYYQEQLDEIKKESFFTTVPINDFNFLKNPLHFLILELTVLKDFNSSPEWIYNRINLNVSLEDIKHSIALLKKLNLIIENERGHFLKNQGHTYNTNNDVFDTAIREHHQQVLLNGAQQVLSANLEFSEFQSFVMNIKSDQIPNARRIIRKCLKELVANVEAAHFSGDESYQLAMQFFPLTEQED